MSRPRQSSPSHPEVQGLTKHAEAVCRRLVVAILSRILKEDFTPPGQLAAAIPPELEKTILRCLRKDPARRFQTMADLMVALEDVASESGARQRLHDVPSRRRWAWPALLLLGSVSWRD